MKLKFKVSWRFKELKEAQFYSKEPQEPCVLLMECHESCGIINSSFKTMA